MIPDARLILAISLTSLVCLTDLFVVYGQEPVLDLREDHGALTVVLDGRDVLTYQGAVVYPPHGVDSVYARGGFIHPLRTPLGHLLTQIQPEDHFHHYGIWNPWTHVAFAGDTLDFWNLSKKEGTVRFTRFGQTSKNSGSVEFEAYLEHVAYPYTDDLVVLNEKQMIRVTRGDGPYVIDLTIDLMCATDEPFHILQYRYGGLGWRATREWRAGNCSVLTSEGRTRENADGSTARWCLLQGTLGDDSGGMLLMSHPGNYNHPEPVRTWPPDYDDAGAVFFNYSPTKTTDWLLEPGKMYTLRYRLVVFDGPMNGQEAEQYWKMYLRK